MTTAKTTYTGELSTQSVHIASNGTIISDAPEDNEGKGGTFSPTDYCATSLAMCMFTIMGIFVKKHDYDIVGSSAEVTKIMASNPRRIEVIEVTMHIKTSRALTDREKEHLQTAALNCPVAKSLHPDIDQIVRFEYV